MEQCKYSLCSAELILHQTLLTTGLNNSPGAFYILNTTHLCHRRLLVRDNSTQRDDDSASAGVTAAETNLGNGRLQGEAADVRVPKVGGRQRDGQVGVRLFVTAERQSHSVLIVDLHLGRRCGEQSSVSYHSDHSTEEGNEESPGSQHQLQ